MKYLSNIAFAVAAVIVAQPAAADTYTKANFSGGVYPGNANVVAPFTDILTQGQSLSGSFIYDNDLIPGGGSGFVNVSQSSFPDVAGFTSGNLFSFNLGGVVLTAANVAAGSDLYIQYADGQFNGFATQLDFGYRNQSYALTISGRTFVVNQLVNGNIDFSTNYVSGYLNTGLTGQTVVRPTVVSPGIPEPATWAMMIVGFGLIGANMRRRTRVTVRFA